jgi:hypothetical protein
MKSLQRLVVATLLAVWCFPAVSLAGPAPADTSGEVGSRASSSTSPPPAQPAPQTEKSALAAREKAAPDLQNFKGGGVYIYLGGGATLILVIILLILIL